MSALTGCGEAGSGGTDAASGGADGAGGAGTAGGDTSGTSGTSTSAGGTGAGGSGVGGSAAGEGDGGDAAGEAGSGGGGPADCQGKAETTVGPFPNISPLERRDIRGNTTGITTPKPGAELTLRVRVYDLDASCAPIPAAVVDVWQCDAAGVYAGYAAFGNAGQDFGRGYQQTDAEGVAEFLTIFPGSYSGRAIHIHFSIQGMPSDLVPNRTGEQLASVFVAQLYFTQSVAVEIFQAFPQYQQGAAITPNESDGIFGDGGRELIVTMTQSGDGYVGEVDIGVSRSAIGM